MSSRPLTPSLPDRPKMDLVPPCTSRMGRSSEAIRTICSSVRARRYRLDYRPLRLGDPPDLRGRGIRSAREAVSAAVDAVLAARDSGVGVGSDCGGESPERLLSVGLGGDDVGPKRRQIILRAADVGGGQQGAAPEQPDP